MDDKIKILMTADTVGGVWTYAVNLCKGLLNQNVEIHLLTMGGSPSNQQVEEIRSLNHVTLYCSNFHLEWMDNPWEDLRLAALWIKSVCDKINPDVIHFNSYGVVSGEWLCPIVTVFHSCVQTWWEAVKGEKAPQEWDEYRNIVHKALLLSDVLVAPSKSILKEAQKIYGKSEFSKVIYNGSDQDRLIKLEEKEHFILTAGRIWDEAKNISILFEITEEIDWPIYIAGNHVNPSTGTIKIPKNIHFLGQLSHKELNKYMQKASIFVMPARYEPFGLAILEAAKTGCALALGQIDSLQEIWQNAALYFNPNDKGQIIETLQRLIKDTELRQKMSVSSFLNAKNFTVEKMADEYINLYKSLLQQRLLKNIEVFV
ncbi:CapM protein, capsular polysaccharide biosynthesis [Legionella wadsworthii]|uniref:CapM protein, capsular polysaccharide biosynthesis n=1 Tax=Legionella wadsworthii TaxID=28088 RepID=A0A378LSS4_9GAMM|nr:glycosyltransferase [Legionella wadsworthii]STY29833.1 CapM protein, capsular polysaccharide biosynthesis [Legionella wadsworthii]